MIDDSPANMAAAGGGNIITIPSSAESDGNSTSVSCFIINKSNFLAYQWGTLDYQEEVVVRPEFKGTEYRTCTITPTRKFESYHAYTILVLSSRNLNCHIKYLPCHSFETKGISHNIHHGSAGLRCALLPDLNQLWRPVPAKSSVRVR